MYKYNEYNARAVKIYNATSSLVRFENKTVFLYIKKCSTLHAGVVAVNLEVVGLAPDIIQIMYGIRRWVGLNLIRSPSSLVGPMLIFN
jgi:hypothetical protein